MKTIFLFSGQGSQHYHMGSKLFQANDVFRKHMLELDEIVRSVQGESVVNALFDPAKKLFDPFLSLRLTHPAIFMVGYSLSKTLESQGIKADYLLGCSLGEVTAASIAGAMSAEDALHMILRQAWNVEDHCDEGKLIAVLHDVEYYKTNITMRNNASLAALNAPSQFVIAGDRERMEEVRREMKKNEVLHQELAVSYGFHAASIDPAAASFLSFLDGKKFNHTSIPLISGITGRQISDIPQDYFWRVVRETTRFSDAIATLEKLIRQDEQIMYIDMSSGSLANMIKYNVQDTERSRGFQIITPFQQEVKKLEEVKNFFSDHRKVSVPVTATRSGPLEAYVFPGQGSQKKGMGEGLFDLFPGLTHSANRILGYSIEELCLYDPQRNLNKTQFTQPALYVVNALSYLKLLKESNSVPDFVAGHSLGEFNALLAAGAFDFEMGLKLVKKRGELMASMKEGGMAAVKGLTQDEIQQVIQRHHLEELDLANFNTPNQIVLSGPRDLIARSGPYFEAAGATLYFPLNVNGAFHSRYMKPAKEEFESFLDQFSFSPLKIPVISNVEASFYSHDRIKPLLAQQLVSPVRWTETITFLLEKGVASFKEVGPGDVLTKLIFRVQQDVQEVKF
jgi:trans-AT polyketide synthase/acyltransferase/oxidoreductase domain-containing protein